MQNQKQSLLALGVCFLIGMCGPILWSDRQTHAAQKLECATFRIVTANPFTRPLVPTSQWPPPKLVVTPRNSTGFPKKITGHALVAGVSGGG